MERLIIVNKSTVKVVLRPDSAVQPGSFNSQSQQQQRSGSNRWGMTRQPADMAAKKVGSMQARKPAFRGVPWAYEW